MSVNISKSILSALRALHNRFNVTIILCHSTFYKTFSHNFTSKLWNLKDFVVKYILRKTLFYMKQSDCM